MSVVFITQYNFNRLTGNQKAQGFGKNGLMMTGAEKLLYPHRKIDWFNDLEASRLYLCQILLLEQDHVLFEKMFGKRWLKIRTPADDYTRAKKPIAPRYHAYVDCVGLTSRFLDFELPVGFKETYGEDGVERFRAWLNTSVQHGTYAGKTAWAVFETDAEHFKKMCESIWTQVSWHHIVLEKHANSGKNSFRNYSVRELETFINNLADEYSVWLATLPENLRREVEWRKRDSWQKSQSAEVNDLLDEFKTKFKWQMRDALIAYYYETAKENGLVGVDNTVLDAFGFECCERCRKLAAREQGGQ